MAAVSSGRRPPAAFPGPGQIVYPWPRFMAKLLEYNATVTARVDHEDTLSSFRLKPDEVGAKRNEDGTKPRRLHDGTPRGRRSSTLAMVAPSGGSSQ